MDIGHPYPQNISLDFYPESPTRPTEDEFSKAISVLLVFDRDRGNQLFLEEERSALRQYHNNFFGREPALPSRPQSLSKNDLIYAANTMLNFVEPKWRAGHIKPSLFVPLQNARWIAWCCRENHPPVRNH